MCLLDFVRDDLSDLAADRDVHDSGLFDSRVGEKVLLAETYLIIEKDDILALYPF